MEDGGFPHTRAATKNQDLRMAMATTASMLHLQWHGAAQVTGTQIHRSAVKSTHVCVHEYVYIYIYTYIYIYIYLYLYLYIQGTFNRI